MSTNRRGAVPWLTGPWTEGLRELKIARIERRLAHNVQAVNELANIMVCDADGLPHAARGPRKREQEPVFSKPMEEYIGNYGGDWHRPVGDAGKARTPSYNFPTDCDRADRAWQEERDACFSDLEEADVIDFPEPASTEERWAA